MFSLSFICFLVSNINWENRILFETHFSQLISVWKQVLNLRVYVIVISNYTRKLIITRKVLNDSLGSCVSKALFNRKCFAETFVSVNICVNHRLLLCIFRFEKYCVWFNCCFSSTNFCSLFINFHFGYNQCSVIATN